MKGLRMKRSKEAEAIAIKDVIQETRRIQHLEFLAYKTRSLLQKDTEYRTEYADQIEKERLAGITRAASRVAQDLADIEADIVKRRAILDAMLINVDTDELLDELEKPFIGN